MSQAQHSQTPADISTRLRRKIERSPRATLTSTSDSPPPSSLSLNVAHARVVGKLRRAASVLEADVGLSLPQVSLNDLERAVSTFLEEVRLGLPRAGISSSRTSSSAGRSYGKALELEIKDPERARRVRANRKEIEAELLRTHEQRRRK